jgi:diacylglycerol O-acyltransferase / wax synthase
MAGQQGRTDVQASNIPGWPQPVYVAGVEMTGSFSFAPLAGTAVMMVMTSYAGRCDIGVNLDAEAVTDPALFEEALREALAEVVEAGREKAQQ